MEELSSTLLAKIKAASFETDCSGWIEAKDEDGVLIETKTFDDSPFSCVRARGELEASTQEVAERLWSMQADDLRRFEKNVGIFQVLQEVDENSRVVFQTIELPWPLQARAFCVLNTRRVEEDGTIYLCMTSIPDFPSPTSSSPSSPSPASSWWSSFSSSSSPTPTPTPPPTKKDNKNQWDFELPESASRCLMANVVLASFVLEPISEKRCRLTRLLHVEPNGNVPAALYNIGRATDMFASFQLLRNVFHQDA